MQITMDTTSLVDYDTFLRVKRLPSYAVKGRTLIIPDEYAKLISGRRMAESTTDFKLSPFLFDYQRDITLTALTKRRYCIFADCGLGKTLMFLEWCRHVTEQLPEDRAILIVSPLMVIKQTLAECRHWYSDRLPIDHIDASKLSHWMCHGKGRIGITNYDSLSDETPKGRIGAIVLDESSMLKSHYGKWGQTCLRLGRGLDWKLACTGTPAPNDRIEYANHAVFMGAFPTVNSFLARFFINRGQTQERWALKPHALNPFYRALSHWAVFLRSPATYGWKDNCEALPPIHTHIHDIALTSEQTSLAFHETGRLFVDQPGGITSRSVLSQIAKGSNKGKRISSNKAAFIRDIVNTWPTESTIIWCIYNAEQDIIRESFPDAANIDGSTPYDLRQTLVDDFKSGRTRVMISKPKVLGFGLNLQIATRQVFSGLQDSYESYYQAVKRSNRYGSTNPLHVHIPVTDIERPMVDNVLRKAAMVDRDTQEQERMYHELSQ